MRPKLRLKISDLTAINTTPYMLVEISKFPRPGDFLGGLSEGFLCFFWYAAFYCTA
jgi:hypothetical protein